MKKLWGNYNFVFGKANTLGFSMASNPIEAAMHRIEVFRETYNNDLPSVFDVHIYNDEKKNAY